MNQDKLWDAFQTDPELRRSFRAGPRLARLIAEVRPRQAVLNVGVGDGSFERMAVAAGLSVSSLDPSERTIRELRNALGLGDSAQVGRAEQMPFPSRSFDIVVMSEVIEHLDDATLEAALDQVVRVLKPGGRLLGTVPADEDLRAGQTVCPHCGKQFHRWGHMQSFTARRLKDVLATRFDVIDVDRCWFADLRYLNWKGRLLSLVKSSLLRLGVGGEGETFFFEAKLL